ncbi:hypothetical protein V1514DRAFT_327887 [Lipomyces japonicus]|uniref:uncharacterized protein n=1 Tax=Lipomyces japonicus TaxID=56871 RepID=UPI0034CD21C0
MIFSLAGIYDLPPLYFVSSIFIYIFYGFFFSTVYLGYRSIGVLTRIFLFFIFHILHFRFFFHFFFVCMQ